jgi:hypothetical protein
MGRDVLDLHADHSRTFVATPEGLWEAPDDLEDARQLDPERRLAGRVPEPRRGKYTRTTGGEAIEVTTELTPYQDAWCIRETWPYKAATESWTLCLRAGVGVVGGAGSVSDATSSQRSRWGDTP